MKEIRLTRCARSLDKFCKNREKKDENDWE